MTIVEEIESTKQLSASVRLVAERLAQVIRGKQEVIDHLVMAVIAGGSILLEDVPGVGKTTLAKTLAAAVELEFQRVQCTPDLLPADIFGFSVLHPQEGVFQFRPGPIFCNLLLVDEINRASPRTQSALLEAMAEGQVTVEGVRHPLRPPFMVIATQNPTGSRGTFPLPESQLDRFLFQLSVGYPDPSSELEMLLASTSSKVVSAAAALSREELLAVQREVERVSIEPRVGKYMVSIVGLTRSDARLRVGVSPRGSLMLARAAQASAYMAGRSYVLPDDVQRVAPLVLAHRIVPARTSDAHPAVLRSLVQELVLRVEVPV